MADGTHIEWTDATWNPITGCSVVSPGCTNCYAMRLAGTRLKHLPSRAGLTVDSKAGPVWNGQVRLNEQWLDQPLRWSKPRRIFVCAHGDLFAENVPDEWIDKVFAVMALAPQHTFQVLTKRAARMRAWFADDATRRAGIRKAYDACLFPYGGLPQWPLPNVWLGVSAEDQRRADERIPELLATPAAIRFVSAEPLLGPIDFANLPPFLDVSARLGIRLDALKSGGKYSLDWIIIGGESGPGARPMHPEWVRSIRDQCASAGTAFFFKQWGEWQETGYQLCDNPLPAGTIGDVPPYWKGAGYGSHRPSMEIRRLGKKKSGRMLDGVVHNAMPKVRA